MRFMTREGTPADLRAQWQEYAAYLESVKHALPAEVREFACAEWHYNPDDPRCLHDGKVRSIEIRPSDGGLGSSIRVIVQGRDGTLWRLQYTDVTEYELAVLGEPRWPPRLPGNHGDWLVDEAGITPRGLIEHRILFSNGGTWAVTCRTFSVLPADV